MKAHDAFTDDAGQKWEFVYEEEWLYEERDGEFVQVGTRIIDLKFRKGEEGDWLRLPPWATIRDGWKITLCFFDEDDDTGEMTYWDVTSQTKEEIEAVEAG